MPLYPLTLNEKVLFYVNVVAMTLWFCCLSRFLILLPLVGRRFLPGGIAEFFHALSWTPLITFFVVRLTRWNHLKNRKNAILSWGLANALHMPWICYGVIDPHPTIARHATYSMMLFSWSLLNTLYYAHQAFFVKTKHNLAWLKRTAYRCHYVTLPVGLVGELGQIFLGLSFTPEGLVLDWALRLSALSAIPFAYGLWSRLQFRALLLH